VVSVGTITLRSKSAVVVIV